MCAMNPRLLRPLATGFNPKSIASLEGWWDASDLSSMAQNSDGTTAVSSTSDPVGYWADKSGNGRHAKQTTNNNRPQVQIADKNGRAGLNFDGSNHYYNCDSGDAFAAAFSIAVVRRTGTPADWAAIYYHRSSQNAAGFSNSAQDFAMAQTANRTGYLFGLSVDGGLFRLNGSAVSGLNSGVFNIRDALLLPNTTDTNIVGVQGNVTSTVGTQYPKIGVDPNSASRVYPMRLYELLVFGELPDAATYQKVEGYLAWKWGLEGSLPTNHPYAYAFPGLGSQPQPSNSEAVDWINRVYSNGGTVSTSTANAVDAFCNAIDAAGIRSRFLRLNLIAGTGLNAALVPLYRGQSLTGTQYGNTTDTNTGPFVAADYNETGASGGLVGNGSSKYLATGLASDSLPSILSGHLSVYMRSNNISATQALVGADDTVNRFGFFLRPSQVLRGSWAEITNSTANNETSSFTTYPTDLYTFTRTAAAESVIYAGATASNTNTVSTSPTAISTPWHVFAANANGSAANFSSARLAAYSIGTGMSSADMTAYNTAMAAFQAAMTRTA